MNRRMLGTAAVACLWAALVPGPAVASDEVLDPVVVRNRLYSVRGRPEVTPSAGLTLVDTLTAHYALSLAVLLNVTETIGVELRGGYAFSRHTGLADTVAEKVLIRDPEPPEGRGEGDLQHTDDLSNLWQLQGFVIGGVRWMPIYGKLSLFAELPVHFNAYLALGAGVGTFSRQSLVACLDVAHREDGSRLGSCNEWLDERRFSPLGSAALGMRFYTGPRGAVGLELRNYVFADEYRLSVDRFQTEQSGTLDPATPVKRGLSQLVLLNLGYTFLF